MNRLIDVRATSRARAATTTPIRRRNMVILRGANRQGPAAALFIAQPDIAAVNSTAQPRRLLRNDGTIETQVIKSVYVADPKLARDNLRFSTGTKVYTLRSFLSANAIRAKSSIDDIDYCSTNNSTVCAIQSISVPVLFAAIWAHFIRDNERHYDMAASDGTDFITIEGAVRLWAVHRMRAHTRQYSNSVKNLFDYVAKWLNERF
jgi:hypothetical protein